MLRRALTDAVAFGLARMLEGDETAAAAIADQRRDGDVTRLQVLLTEEAHDAHKTCPDGPIANSLRVRAAALAVLRGDLDGAEVHLWSVTKADDENLDAPALLSFVKERQREADRTVFAEQPPKSGTARPKRPNRG